MSFASPPEPLDPRFRLKLPSFEGPLDLLLHLIQKHELDILDLPIAFVTERYLEYVRVMERLDLDVAGEYLLMAATLAHIKSKMLLPSVPADQAEEGPGEEEVDPRAELIRRLLEYQKYKAAAEELGARGVAGRDVFLRGVGAPEASGPVPLAGIGLFELLDAFRRVLERAKKDLSFEVTADGISIQERMTQLVDHLRERRHCTFDALFDDTTTVYDIVVTFLAILEMAKRRLARLYQSGPSAPIHVEYRVLDADTQHADEAAKVASADPPPAEVLRAAPEPPAPERPARTEDPVLATSADERLDLGGTLAQDPRPAAEPSAPAGDRERAE
jgi:segregation and condensation protein A